MTRLGVIGGGRVGLVIASCMARMGHSVVCVDRDDELVSQLCDGVVPYLEPGLEDVVREGLSARRLSISTSCHDLAGAEAVFLAVDSPASKDGVDTRNLKRAIVSIAGVAAAQMPVVVVKSTVAPGTTDDLQAWLASEHGLQASFVVNPEFLREGSAVQDFICPDRVVVGSRSKEAADLISGLYRSLGCRVLLTGVVEAELIKLASNAFLAARVSLINEIASLCAATGANVTSVTEGIGLDHRIGAHYLQAGLGFGGSCLPKDVRILVNSAAARSVEMKVLPSITSSNEQHLKGLTARMEEALGCLGGKCIAVLGIAFKPGTDDIRESPGMLLVDELIRRGASVRIADPASLTSGMLPEGCLADPYEAASGCDAIVLATRWPALRRLDFGDVRQRMRGDLVVDACNALDTGLVVAAGLRYLASGRPSAGFNEPAP